ncbi:MAG: hypothetical protein NVS3B25_28050 [Hymenobacter sp.]
MGRFGQQQVGGLAVGEGLRQLLQLAHFRRTKGGRVFKDLQKRGAGHGGK